MDKNYPRFGQVVFLRKGTASYEMMSVADRYETTMLKKSASRPYVVVSNDRQNAALSMVTVSPLKTVHVEVDESKGKKIVQLEDFMLTHKHQKLFLTYDDNGEPSLREIVRAMYTFPKDELLIAKRDKDLEKSLKGLLVQKGV